MEEARNTKPLKIIGIVAVIIVLGSLVYLGAKQITQPKAPNPFKDAKPTTEAEVRITRSGFVPATITVMQDSQVTFTNEDRTPHQIASDQQTLSGDFGSDQPLNTGDTFTFTFDQAGRFTYYDFLNPNSQRFKGLVIVE